MKKITVISIFLMVLVTSVHAGKITGKLFYQVKFKEMYNRGEFEKIPSFIKNSPDLKSQLFFIHFAEKPSPKQIARLNELGIEIYLKSWTPPLKNHPTGFLAAKMPVSLTLLHSLENLDFVKQMDSAELELSLALDLAAEDIGVSAISSAPDSLSGEGVKIAVIDSGFELDHEDLPTPLTAVDYSFYTDAVPDSDFTVSNEHTGTGHGTYVAGCIVGQGTLSEGTWKGMAPDADWIALKIAQDYTGVLSYLGAIHSFKAARFYYDADFINASFGGWDVYHDGSDEADQVVDLVSEDGCCVFVATGNYADKNLHFSGNLNGGETSDFIAINAEDSSSTRASYVLNLVWYDSPDTTVQRPMTLEFFNSNYQSIAIQSVSDITQSPRGTQSRYGSCTTIGNPIYVKVTNLSGENMDFHLFVDSGNCKFSEADSYYTIISPATADLAFSIGAYVTRTEWYNYNFLHCWTDEVVEDIGTFSSCGPRMDGFQEPFITAPGSMIISLRDDDAYGGPPFGAWSPNVISNSGDGGGLPADYLINQGTSAASPIACGAAALLKDFDPQITRDELYIKLWNHARTDGFTGNVPNSIWGAGKMDVEASLNALKEDLTPLTPENIRIEINNEIITISWDEVTHTNNGREITADYYKVFVYDSPYSPVYSEYYETTTNFLELPTEGEKQFYKVVCGYNP